MSVSMFKSFLRLVNPTTASVTLNSFSLGQMGPLKGTMALPLSFSTRTRSVEPSRPRAAHPPQITFYHNTSSPLSHHLATKLARFQHKFAVEYRVNQFPHFDDYMFCHSQCLHMHPSNARVFGSIFVPAPTGAGAPTNANVSAGGGSARVHDMDAMPAHVYHTHFSADDAVLTKPLIIDYANSLIATDDAGLDRIMANYVSCGMQTSRDTHSSPHSLSSTPHHPVVSKQTHQQHQREYDERIRMETVNKYGHQVVHPHIAEYADLF